MSDTDIHDPVFGVVKNGGTVSNTDIHDPVFGVEIYLSACFSGKILSRHALCFKDGFLQPFLPIGRSFPIKGNLIGPTISNTD